MKLFQKILLKYLKKTFLVSVDHYSDNFELNQLKDLRPTTVIQKSSHHTIIKETAIL